MKEAKNIFLLRTGKEDMQREKKHKEKGLG